jgi:hypothetical protein
MEAKSTYLMEPNIPFLTKKDVKSIFAQGVRSGCITIEDALEMYAYFERKYEYTCSRESRFYYVETFIVWNSLLNTFIPYLQALSNILGVNPEAYVLAINQADRLDRYKNINVWLQEMYKAYVHKKA